MEAIDDATRSKSKFPSSQVLWKMGEAAGTPHRLTIVSKVTYALRPGRSEPSPAQEPIFELEDLAPFKPRADVLVIGDTKAIASVTVGGVVKRSPTGAARPSPPAPPSGVWNLPGSFDLGAFNVAPGDQQGATILPAELTVRVEPAWPGAPSVTTTLAPVNVKAILQSPDFMDAIALEIDTVVVDVDRLLCMVTMRGTRVLPGAPDTVATNLAFDVATHADHTTSDARPSPIPALPFAAEERRRGTMEIVLPPRSKQASLPSYLMGPPAPPRIDGPRVDGLPFARDGGNAASHGAVAASDEAARASRDPSEVGARAPFLEPRAPGSEAPPAIPSETLELLWVDTMRAAEVQQAAVFTQLFDEGAGKRSFVQGKVDVDEATRLTRGALRVLTCAATTSTAELEATLAHGGPRDAGPAFAVVSGELTMSFDDRDWMRVALAALGPTMRLDPELSRVGDAARAIVDDPWAPSRVLLPTKNHLRSAYDRNSREGEHLDALVQRELLERRCFKKRVILGEERLRGAFSASRNEPPLPAYLSAATASMLPLYERFSVRLLCEVRRRQDALESHAYALVVVAIARRHAS